MTRKTAISRKIAAFFVKALSNPSSDEMFELLKTFRVVYRDEFLASELYQANPELYDTHLKRMNGRSALQNETEVMQAQVRAVAVADHLRPLVDKRSMELLSILITTQPKMNKAGDRVLFPCNGYVNLVNLVIPVFVSHNEIWIHAPYSPTQETATTVEQADSKVKEMVARGLWQKRHMEFEGTFPKIIPDPCPLPPPSAYSIIGKSKSQIEEQSAAQPAEQTAE